MEDFNLRTLILFVQRSSNRINEKEKIEMKTRLVHIDVINSAFERYLREQLIPADLIPVEIRNFNRILAQAIVQGKYVLDSKKEEK